LEAKQKKRNVLLAYLAVLVAVVGVSGSGPLGKMAVKDGVDPSVLALYRIILSQFIVIPMVLSKKDRREEVACLFTTNAKFLIYSLIAGLFLAMHYITWYTSVTETTVYRATVISDISPIFSMLLTWLLLREAPRWRQVLTMFISIAGVIMISACGANEKGGSLAGDIYALLAGVGWAAYFVFGQKIRSGLSVWVYTLIVNIFCLIFLLGYILIAGKSFAMSPTILLVAIFVAVFGTIVGHTLLNWALPVTGATFVSLACLGETFISVLLAWWLHNEIPMAITFVGGVICVAGMAGFALWKGKNKPAEIEK
jgi:drug/metabolite transporter (DMT)-like permease